MIIIKISVIIIGIAPKIIAAGISMLLNQVIKLYYYFKYNDNSYNKCYHLSFHSKYSCLIQTAHGL